MNVVLRKYQSWTEIKAITVRLGSSLGIDGAHDASQTCADVGSQRLALCILAWGHSVQNLHPQDHRGALLHLHVYTFHLLWH